MHMKDSTQNHCSFLWSGAEQRGYQDKGSRRKRMIKSFEKENGPERKKARAAKFLTGMRRDQRH
jgi:hypothetical protein